MCSLNGGDLVLINNDKDIKLDDCFCLKCKTEKASVKLRGSDVYCNSCFLSSATHKFRATLGKSKIVRPRDKILVAYSGKSGSVALLNMIKAGMHESVHKRLIFETKVLYIDDGFLSNKNLEQRQEKINQIITQTTSLGFKFFVTSLAQVLSPKDPELFDLETYKCSHKDEENLMKIYDKLSDETSKKDFLHKIREKLFVKVARYLDCGKIFLDEDSTSLAVTVMTNVSLGRGAQLSSDVGFVDDRHEGVMILRPMRDFTRLELQYFMDIHKLESFDNMEKSQVNPYTSIQGLTEQFVVDLDTQFGGTVATIFRTGEKLSSKSKNSTIDEARCLMCDGSLDTNCLESSTSAIEATNFSRLVSAKGSLAEHDLDALDASDKGKTANGCGNCSGNCQTKNNSLDLTFDNSWKFICYACRRIFKDEKNFDEYFLRFMKENRERIVLDNMRDEIKDFLL